MPDTRPRPTLGRIDHSLRLIEVHLKSIAASFASIAGKVRTDDEEHLPGPSRSYVAHHPDQAQLATKWFPQHQLMPTPTAQPGIVSLYSDHTGTLLGTYAMSDTALVELDPDVEPIVSGAPRRPADITPCASDQPRSGPASPYSRDDEDAALYKYLTEVTPDAARAATGITPTTIAALFKQHRA